MDGSPHERTAISRPLRRRSMTASTVARNDRRLKWIFFSFGMAVLLSWNVLITATPYFLSRLEGNRLRGTFNSYLSLTYTGVNFACLAYATATASSADSKRRIRRSASFILASLFSLAISPLLSMHRGFFFAFVLLNATIQASAGSLLQSAVVGLAALFGPDLIAIMFTGQAVVGVAVSVVQYVAAVSSAPKNSGGASSLIEALDAETASGPSTSLSLFAFIFFGLASAYMGLFLLTHAYLIRMPVYQDLIESVQRQSQQGIIVEEAEDDEDLEDEPFLGPSHSVELQTPGEVSIMRVAKSNAVLNGAVGWVFVVTLSIFPPITSSILSVHTTSTLKFFSPILFVSLHFLIFNIGDWIGRFICSFPQFHIWSSRRLSMLSLSRTLFIPLFLACNVSRSASSPGGSPLINSDLLYFLILIAFGMSNGFLATMCMMAASSLEHNPKLKQEEINTAATVAQFCLIGGLALGSLFSFGVRGIICDCNPFLS